LNEINEILSDFEFFDSWEDKYQYIIDLGKKLTPIEDRFKRDEYKLKGCQSTVYFITKENPDGTLRFFANSDAFIVQGLIALLLKVFSNKHPLEILKININFLTKIGLENHLSPTRKNGLHSMIEKIRAEAKLRIDSFEK
tara:strand:- start:100 stop:519 length:420 start_codon:yes stop_codon:yes gene_type:complete